MKINPLVNIAKIIKSGIGTGNDVLNSQFNLITSTPPWRKFSYTFFFPKLLKSYLQPFLVLQQHLMVVPLNQYNAEVKERETAWEWWRGIPHRWGGRDRNKETSCVSRSSSIPSEKTQESPAEILTGPTGPISEVSSEMLSILIYFKQNIFLKVYCSRASLVAQW